jgi:hypothetical protein
MVDFFYLAIVTIFFLASLRLITVCQQLMGD